MGYGRTEITDIRSATESHYDDLVSQGYRWDTNVSRKEAETLAEKKRVEGLEVVIGDVAFIPKPVVSGFTRDLTAKAILVRKPAKK